MRFHFNSSEVKQGSEHIQRFHFNSSEVKQRSVRRQRTHFNGAELKTVVSTMRDLGNENWTM